ncbi:MAG TPA: DNA-binding transcriptional regulator [Pirellulales bacterium]|nr:DNA-binding transcriptional regulator [Pirellulales bacterium]
MRRRPVVALLVETSNAYARGLVEGIVGYVRKHDAWSLYLPELRRGEVPTDWSTRWKGDGIIARIENAKTAEAVARTRLPIVDVSAARLLPNVPWVETDDDAIVRAAFEHLRERGFRSFAYCGDPRFNWSRWREERFVQLAAAGGARCDVFRTNATTRRGSSWTEEHRRLCDWVRALAKPVGILACYDIQAQRLLDACREADVAVPEAAAVLGVDDDRLLCDLCTPSLSSVQPDTYRTGYQAAELLDRQLRGESVDAGGYRIPPRGIAVRQSTDVSAINDPAIAEAIRFIREHACDGVNATDVFRRSGLSRRVFEARFQKTVGRTPHEEILRIKLERVQRLLTETSLTLTEIADRTAFLHVEYLSVAFKRVVGVSPSRYRAEPHGERKPALIAATTH